MAGPMADITAEMFRTRPGSPHLLTREARRALDRLERAGDRSRRLSPLTYNLTISHHHRFVWYRVAKAASRTIREYFNQHTVPLDVDHVYRVSYPTTLFSGYFKFAFVRHPFGRLLSTWQDKVVNQNYFGFDPLTQRRLQRDVEAFADWVGQQNLTQLGDPHIALQTRLVDLTQVDFLGRIETFDADFAETCRRIGLPTVAATPVHQTAHQRPSTVPRHLRSTLANIYAKDYQVLGYDPDDPA